MNLWLLCVGIIFVISFRSWNVGAKKTFLCYYNAWASVRSGDSRFTMDDIDPNLCTHLGYHSVEIDIKTRINLVYSQFEEDKIKLIGLKQKNPQLKVLVYIIVKPDLRNDKELFDKTLIDGFIENVLDILKQNKMDGIILRLFSTKEEKIGYTNLVNAMKKEFQFHSYILAVVGTAYDINQINEKYDITSLSRDVDFLILLAYEFHEPSKEPNWADHSLPLYKPPWGKNHNNINFVISHWINKGFQSNKILLEISFYGGSWTLSTNKIAPPAPAFGPDQPGKYTDGSGVMTYYEICQAVKFEGWQVFQDPNKRMGPYAVSPAGQNRTWVGYDDPAMAVIKSKYILSKGLGGAAVWDVSQDDFRNKCGDGPNPMLKAIHNTLLTNHSINRLENVLYRQKVAFVFSLVVSISSCITIIYMCFIIFQNTLKRAKINIPSVHYTADYDDIL